MLATLHSLARVRGPIEMHRNYPIKRILLERYVDTCHSLPSVNRCRLRPDRFKLNLASGLFRERAASRLALALRRLVGRHIGLGLGFVRLRFLIFLIAFLSLRHGDPPD